MLVHRTTCRQTDCSPVLVLEFNGNVWNVCKERILRRSISVYLCHFYLETSILEIIGDGIINFVILIIKK